MIRATPPETIDGRLHITEQGEIISQHYGLRTNALRSLERAFGVLGIATLARRRGTVRTEQPEHHQLVNALAEHSRSVWRALFVDDHEFNDFFRAVTPIDVIERMQIGSRSIWECAHPGSGVLAIRATPWVFAWSQARYFLPGWYGRRRGPARQHQRAGFAAAASGLWPVAFFCPGHRRHRGATGAHGPGDCRTLWRAGLAGAASIYDSAARGVPARPGGGSGGEG